MPGGTSWRRPESHELHQGLGETPPTRYTFLDPILDPGKTGTLGHQLDKAHGQPTASIAKRLQEGLCYGRVARRAPMTVWKKMSRIGGQHVVEIDADIRKLAKDR